MGLQLWYSPITGIKRKGTTFTELQELFIDNITTKFIYEPIACCEIYDSANEVKNLMLQRDFDILGVRKNDIVVGYVRRQDLEYDSIEKYMVEFDIDNVISDSTPIAELLELLTKNGHMFILTKNKISGIVAKADINKPIVRIYLFGIISLFELHLNYWIVRHYGIEGWQSLVGNNRLATAQNLFRERQGQNLELTLLECLQLCDKREILRQTDQFRKTFGYSKNKFESLLKDIEKIRNEIAHSQSSIIANLAWQDFVSRIDEVKSFLSQSEIERV